MGINDFLDTSGKSKVKRFQQASEGKSKKETRSLEQTMLRPEKLPPISKFKGGKDALSGRTIKIVFPDNASSKLFRKYFRVSSYVENSVTNISLLLLILEDLESERIIYNEKEGTISYPRRRDS